MGVLLSLLFQGLSPRELGDLPIHEYEDHPDEPTHTGFFANDLIMIHPSIPRLTWLKVVNEGDAGPESFLRVIPLSVYTYTHEPSLDPEHHAKLNDLGDTVLEENRLYILVPDFRASVFEALGLGFLSPYTYTETQAAQSLTATYEAMINAALSTTYTRVRFPPLSIKFAGPWIQAKPLNAPEAEEYDYRDMARLTAQALATACSRQRLAMMYEQGKTFEMVLSKDEHEAFSNMIKALT